MKHRLKILSGTPYRLRGAAEERDERKLDLGPSEPGSDDPVVPVPVRIEIAGGRSSTASAMRANRVVRGLEDVGAWARTVELEGGRAVVEGEADRDQAEHAAGLPFVARIRRA